MLDIGGAQVGDAASIVIGVVYIKYPLPGQEGRFNVDVMIQLIAVITQHQLGVLVDHVSIDGRGIGDRLRILDNVGDGDLQCEVAARGNCEGISQFEQAGG